MTQKWYGVNKGRVNAVYDDRDEALKQVEGLDNWRMRSFFDFDDAHDFAYFGRTG